MDIDEHIKAIEEWLKENVLVYPTPRVVTLLAFKVAPAEYKGSFEVSLDGVLIPEEFSFGLGGNGKPELFLPMFHSPLGAPASYAAVSLTQETTAAIQDLLTSILPKMKALGRNQETGESLYHWGNTSRRIIDKGDYEARMEKVSRPNFSVSHCFDTGTQHNVG